MIRTRYESDPIAEAVVAMEELGRSFREALTGEHIAETRRRASVLRQKQDGRTGGGAKCAWCGKQLLRRMENGHGARQCDPAAGGCGHASRIRVTVKGLVVEKVA